MRNEFAKTLTELAEHNKDFRAHYLNWKGKKYPKKTNRKKLGLNFYHNIICDKRKNWEGPFMYKFLSKHFKTITIIAPLSDK